MRIKIFEDLISSLVLVVFSKINIYSKAVLMLVKNIGENM